MTERKVRRFCCAVPGCGVAFMVDVLDPRFPLGPFYCRAHRQPYQSPTASPDEPIDLASASLDELDADGAVVSVTIPLPKKW